MNIGRCQPRTRKKKNLLLNNKFLRIIFMHFKNRIMRIGKVKTNVIMANARVHIVVVVCNKIYERAIKVKLNR